MSDRISCSEALVLRWKVDSTCLEGDEGENGGLCCAGEDVGVEGPRNEASLLLIVDQSEGGRLFGLGSGAKPTTVKKNQNRFRQDQFLSSILWAEDGRTEHI